MSYLSVLLLLFTSLLSINATNLLENDQTTGHLTTTSSESYSQSDSSKTEIVSTLKQEITVKSSIQIDSNEEKVDSMLKDMRGQLNQKISSVEKDYELLQQKLLTNAEKEKMEYQSEAKAFVIYFIFSIISLLLVMLFRARGQPTWVSIFGLTLIVLLALTLLKLPKVYIHYRNTTEKVLTSQK